ncbi:F420-dependent protein [Rhodococcus ruber Chol-4]|uniref:PPOX class F420-dependent oxidoreductase n=1 Tax=Rhodococcus TaxID=1827 RepID=UPI00034C6F26|nr:MULTISPECIES: PPOX class F420-dependent oxidoreductase [Rhodococcus]MDO2381463.1 PPOX class F420-dependent oxidoreductase [Rhodococcus ruber]MDX5310151.1 PPOX class F420-dependent oxidoreductase [Rhodococcus sp. (in: high G+C Gram-positive bacteria)]AXY52379.1 F420-dependent protein [Rhodococcus ruber]KXF86742.1 F420-dependent protein [Rhodococcus ruber Chol-4]MBP2211742.1 PPOX class probable F420-dependent enzyme [Rhodococcus ruber]
MTPTFADLAAAKYVLLTTFRRDGTPVPTAVWAAADADRLLVWTVTDSYKVRRLRRDPRITVAVCDVRGTPRSDAVPGTATVLDAAGTERARATIARKYGILGWLTVKGSVLRRGRAGTVGLACVVEADDPTPDPGPGG